MSLARISAIAATVSILAGCAAPQSVPARDIHALETAERICNVGSLTQEYNRMRSEARSLTTPSHWSSNWLLAPWPGHYIDRHSTTSTSQSTETGTRPPFGPSTPTIDLVRTFEVDLDASYRASTASCQAHAACMYQNRYNEGYCQRSGADWQIAQERFQSLSYRLADVRVRMAEICPDCPPLIVVPHHRGQYGYGHSRYGRHYPPYRRHRDCEDYIGGVFTTSSCRY
ncbi:MAG: hypothetical protein ACQRW7_11210 [Caulobacterales bacterium]|uniref:hypothetical protein n=1 Tax=Glycocaulis sp. TaxID=1969725 RepID=UPI003F9EDED7